MLRIGVLAVVLFIAGSASHGASPVLRVALDGRTFTDAGGKPFLWLGDTAWMLFQAADRPEAELYLDTRAKQGFTVIQAALVMGQEAVGGTFAPNRYGATAFVKDASQPNVTAGARVDTAEYDYWDHADFIIEAAEKRGLVLALLPLFVGSRGDGYKYLNSGTAAAYGRFLGERYRAKDIVWVLGGDHAPKEPVHFSTWTLLAKAITEAVAGKDDYTRTMMTFHPRGKHSSSQWWHDAPWLDFNMLQTWEAHTTIDRQIQADYKRSPAKPCVMSEGAYEDGPQYPTGPVDALMIRKQAYWSYFAGGYHTYGNTNVWNFGTFAVERTQDWQAALHSPGAESMTTLKRFMDSLPWWKLAPAPNVRVRRGNIGSVNPMHLVVNATDGSGAVVYFSGPDRVTIDMSKMKVAKLAKATWIDPRDGTLHVAGEYPTNGEQTFECPKGWPDALLLLDGGLRENRGTRNGFLER